MYVSGSQARAFVLEMETRKFAAIKTTSLQRPHRPVCHPRLREVVSLGNLSIWVLVKTNGTILGVGAHFSLF